MLLKSIMNIIEVVILAKILYRVGSFFLVKKKFGKTKKGKSIVGKVGYIMYNNTHSFLDNRIKSQIAKQKAKRLADEPQAIDEPIIYKVYKGSKAN